ncbi:hypothetical protein [Photobacterium sp. J15]|uniref:hypothetical protein n=1 Tax=Photobacterium sp. J15 TaxID=265901 RepID=UPI0007E3FC31|nr:hypothetical protein [Photobacterium sp. J15]
MQVTDFYKVAVVDYFATGEGRTVFIVTGNDKKIEDEIHEFFRIGIISMSPRAWLAEDKMGDKSEFRHEVDTIKSFAPMLWMQIQEIESESTLKGYCDYSMSHHTNYS